MSNLPYFHSTPMPFGKHKGKRMDEVPKDYKLWLCQNPEGSEKYPSLPNLKEEHPWLLHYLQTHQFQWLWEDSGGDDTFYEEHNDLDDDWGDRD